MKHQSEVWVTRNTPLTSKVGRQRSLGGKHMFAIFLIKFRFNTIIPLENGKTVTAKWCAEKCLSNVWKQMGKHRRLNELLMHHHTNNGVFRNSTY